MINSFMNKDMVMMALVAFLIAMTAYLYMETRWLKTSLYALEDGMKDVPEVSEEPNKEEEQEEVNGSGDA